MVGYIEFNKWNGNCANDSLLTDNQRNNNVYNVPSQSFIKIKHCFTKFTNSSLHAEADRFWWAL